MNELENYRDIVVQYFGADTTTFDTTTGATNHVIAALNSTAFAPFRSAFLARLKRLATRYSNSDSKTHLVKTLNDLATGNWAGAYAELATFDFLNRDQDWLSGPITLSKTVPASETLALSLGQQNVNFDGYYDDFGVSFDVKVLSDKSKAILDGVIGEVITSLDLVGRVTIRPEYPLDLDFKLFQNNRSRLITELQSAIDAAAKISFVESHVVSDLKYRLLWQEGVLSTISTYNPYLHAANHHSLLFLHAKKFSRTEPCLIIFVIFPWFSEQVIGHLGTNETFFRSFCRRFFCQYAKDFSPAQKVLKSFNGPETVDQITNKLSGVLFLEDKLILPPNENGSSINGFAYLNPNALHKVSEHFRNHLSNLGFRIDDFEYDNY